jgi:hypothetical protein
MADRATSGRADKFAMLQQRHAALHPRFFEPIKLLEEAVGHRLVGGHNLSSGCNSGGREGRNSGCEP